MVRHAIDCEHFVVIFLIDTGDVLIKFIFPFVGDETGSVLNSEYKLRVDFGVGVCHIASYLMIIEYKGVSILRP
jgi:hypothetical protein